MNDWIPTTRQMPPILTEVLVYFRHLPQFALFFSDGGGNLRDGTPVTISRIKLWSPLTPVPDEFVDPIKYKKRSKSLSVKRPPSSEPQVDLYTAAGSRGRPKRKTQSSP